jgi:LCP family protein required for cell wall assembly
MRTTLKRGVGRGASNNGNGRAVFPPGLDTPNGDGASITRYRQPPPDHASALGLVGRILLIVFLAITSLGVAIAGGAYLYVHQSVDAVQAHTKSVVRASDKLDLPVANHAANALIIGYDHRANEASTDPSLSDTLMLVRADPSTNTISLLSFPRDLEVPIYCGHSESDTQGYVYSPQNRINSAYSDCKESGTVLTIKHLTNLPINYLITVNFHGFKEVVDKLGGVWMDVDRRYYNKNTGSGYNDYANINLQPGYQLLGGQEALDFVRFRHTDDDLHRNARQQEFVRSLREQISRSFSLTEIPSLVKTVTNNVEVGEGGGRKVGLSQILQYARFAAALPAGHLFQDRIENVVCHNTCTVSTNDLQTAIDKFQNPDVASSKQANAAALGIKQKAKQKVLPPSKVSVTVLNGNGIQGAAANASYLLAQRGYRTEVPPNGLEANGPSVFHSKVYYDPAQAGSKGAAKAMQALLQPADIQKLPRTPTILQKDPGSMLVVVLGQAFSGTIAPPVSSAPVLTHQAPSVRYDASSGLDLLKPLQSKVDFPLLTPTVLDRNSSPDTLPGDKPARVYWIDAPLKASRGKHKAVRLVFHDAVGNGFWGIEETNWTDAPLLGDRSFRRSVGGREMNFYYNGTNLHMIVINAHGATYWVVNTLLDDLSNETMIAIAKGLKPLTSVK